MGLPEAVIGAREILSEKKRNRLSGHGNLKLSVLEPFKEVIIVDTKEQVTRVNIYP